MKSIGWRGHGFNHHSSLLFLCSVSACAVLPLLHVVPTHFWIGRCDGRKKKQRLEARQGAATRRDPDEGESVA